MTLAPKTIALEQFVMALSRLVSPLLPGPIARTLIMRAAVFSMAEYNETSVQFSWSSPQISERQARASWARASAMASDLRVSVRSLLTSLTKKSYFSAKARGQLVYLSWKNSRMCALKLYSDSLAKRTRFECSLGRTTSSPSLTLGITKGCWFFEYCGGQIANLFFTFHKRCSPFHTPLG